MQLMKRSGVTEKSGEHPNAALITRAAVFQAGTVHASGIRVLAI